MKYDQIRNDIKTGDIILFSGKGAISDGIKLFTFSKWSHVGMALRLPNYDTVFLWESTTLSTLKDAIDGINKNGVQLVLLSERLRTYGSEVSVRHLQNFHIDPSRYSKLLEFRREVRNRPYEKNYIELMKSAFDGPFGKNEEDLSSIFCSELVAEAYQQIGLLSFDIPANEYTPKDFSEQGNLALLPEASLSREIAITL